jgi:hypothetical protein
VRLEWDGLSGAGLKLTGASALFACRHWLERANIGARCSTPNNVVHTTAVFAPAAMVYDRTAACSAMDASNSVMQRQNCSPRSVVAHTTGTGTDTSLSHTPYSVTHAKSPSLPPSPFLPLPSRALTPSLSLKPNLSLVLPPISPPTPCLPRGVLQHNLSPLIIFCGKLTTFHASLHAFWHARSASSSVSTYSRYRTVPVRTGLGGATPSSAASIHT